MDTFSGHRSTVSHQSVHPSNPLPCQDRERPHPPGKIARSHFVFKVLASECFFFFFAWRLPKPAVWDESLIIHHRLQTQVVQVLGMQPEPAQVHVHPDGCSGSVPRGFSGAARGPPPQPCWHLPVEPRPNGFLLWFCSLGMRTDGRTDRQTELEGSSYHAVFSEEPVFFNEDGTTTAECRFPKKSVATSKEAST